MHHSIAKTSRRQIIWAGSAIRNSGRLGRLFPSWPKTQPALLSLALHLLLCVLLLLLRIEGRDMQTSALVLRPPVVSEPLHRLPPVEVELEIQTEREVEVPHINVELSVDSMAGSAGAYELQSRPVAVHRPTFSGLFVQGVGRGSGDAVRGQGAGSGGGGRYMRPFDVLVEQLQHDGLDLVLVFDSTSSMGLEIQAVKHRLLQVGKLLLDRLPDSQISLIAYKDTSDLPPLTGIGLTNDLQALHRFLATVEPTGGGADIEEAVALGLHQAIHQTAFRNETHKVILLFGDAPPRATELAACLQLAHGFHAYAGGKISTVSCRAPVPEFASIARAAGGETIVLRQHGRLLEELMLLIFGERYRKQAAAFFQTRP